MPKIKILPPHEAQKIAAGQVIERPAHVIKELIENAIDANASRILIYIEDGGKQLMRVVDNGHGMDREDAQLCLTRHATSKICSVDELSSLTSHGFRGEALACIAAAGKITILTRQAESSEGTKVSVSVENNIVIEACACLEGTDITVTDLFYTMPARAKFLKKRETEIYQITQIVHALSLAYPSRHFQLFIDEKLSINCPPHTTSINRCASIWGPMVTHHLIALSEQTVKVAGLTISGAITRPTMLRYDRKNIFFLVNNRWITNQHLGRALLKGYGNILPHGRYPLACLTLHIDPTQIDINTHPKKEEILFAHPRIVEQAITDTVHAALEANTSQYLERIPSEHSYSPGGPQTLVSSISFHAAPSLPGTITRNIATSHEIPHAIIPQSTPSQIKLATNPETITSHEQMSTIQNDTGWLQSFKLLGQLHDTYLLLEHQDGLYIIDQHAAHERVLYELFGTQQAQIPTVNLLFTHTIPCSTEDLALLEPHLELFHEHGIMIEQFGKNQLIVKAIPIHVKNVPVEDLIQQTIEWIREYNHLDESQFATTIHNKLQAQMACKAAVKAGDSLSLQQMEKLLEELNQCPNRFSCPHGRPTGFLIPLADIEKQCRRR